MFVNKVGNFSKIDFRGFQHLKNEVGEPILRFNYPYDYEHETCEIQIFKVRPDKNYNYKIDESPIAKVMLEPEGTDVNIQEITNLAQDEPFAYKYIRRDKNTGEVISEGADTGVKIKNENGRCIFRINGNKEKLPSDIEGKNYDLELNQFQDSVSNYTHTFVSRKGTTPVIQGAGYLAIPDSLLPGAKYRGFNDTNTGDLYFDKEYQKNIENVIKTFSNNYGGSIAGLETMIPEWKSKGYKVIFSTPIANGDDVSSHGYWNKNNLQIASKMGNTENFATFMRKLFKNGMIYVYDGTFTSEGLEGIRFQHALRWADKNPQSYYWFRMDGIKNSSLGLGVVPENKENLRHRIINAPFEIVKQSDGTYETIPSRTYDPNKETLFQIYDASQVSESQKYRLDKPIRIYENLKSGNELSINSHNDTVISYVFQINPNEYLERLKVVNNLIKNNNKNVDLESADGTLLISQFSNFKITKKTEGGFQTWDANTDMAKLRYHISGYDAKRLQAITDPGLRYIEQQKMERASKEVQDMTIQAGKYWTQKQKNIVELYTAKTIGRTKDINGIKTLIAKGDLPKEAEIDNETLSNILNGYYILSPKLLDDKKNVTIKSLMELPLDSLEFGENTVGVLATSYFSNRATTDETIGLSRFDLMKKGNPHLVDEYKNTYTKVNNLYKNELNSFADDIIKEIDKISDEKLLNTNGEYTEYGEYVIEHFGQDIAKYALLKSLAADNFKTKILENGDITYDYDSIKSATTLKALGINANNPKQEAELLYDRIQEGLKNLTKNDVEFVSKSIAQRIYGTDVNSFRLAEAIYNRSGLGLSWRLDALKDIADMDSVRNRENSFDDLWDVNIDFWSKFVEEIKNINPNSHLEAEITDIEYLMKDTYGLDSIPYEGKNYIGQKFNGEFDAMVKFFNETGITSEAAYSYMFTSVLKMLAPNFENGTDVSKYHDDVKHRIDLLLQTRSVDYLRNLYTFLGNHDKPRMIHGLAIDLKLFHSPILYNYTDDGHAKFDSHREQRLDIIRVLSGASSQKEVPIELRLNVDNMDYFRTISARAAAQSKLLIDSIDDSLSDKLSEKQLSVLKQAISDITNGNYLANKDSVSVTRINIPELSSLENAFNEVLNLAQRYGLKLSSEEKQHLINSVIEIANSSDLNKYLVKEESKYYLGNSFNEVCEQNRNALKDIMGSSDNYELYSIYTIQLARLLKDSYTKSGLNYGTQNIINEAFKDFVKKYNRNIVDTHTAAPKLTESAQEAQRKNSYGSRDIRTAIRMIFNQAEFKTDLSFTNKEDLIERVYKAATEPAVAKAAIGTEILKSLIGINTTYYADEYGNTGLEDKAKNNTQQNRMPMRANHTEYEKQINKYMTEPIKDRSDSELMPLNNGVPYMLDIVVNNKNRDELCKRITEINNILKTQNISDAERNKLEDEKRSLSMNLARFAYLRQSANGDMTISIVDTGWVNNDNRYDYFKHYGLETKDDVQHFFKINNIDSINPENKYVPIMNRTEFDYILLGAGIALPTGLTFTNANGKDKVKYIVEKIGEYYKIARQDGKKIVMDGLTSRNGVMLLKHTKKIGFKGNAATKLHNSIYNVANTAYKNVSSAEYGKNLSVISV